MLVRGCAGVTQPFAIRSVRSRSPPIQLLRQALSYVWQAELNNSSRYRLITFSPPNSACSSRAAGSSSSSMGEYLGDVFFLDEFAIRQWDDPKYSGTRIEGDKQAFVDEIHRQHSQGAQLVDGYAPFCKHIFVQNFVGAKLPTLEITSKNRHLLQCGYSRRRPEELPVLTRWFPADAVEVPTAKYLDIILYSREQLVKEHKAMPKGRGDPESLPDAPWGIISIKAQDEDHETPMQPITIMRNSLGPEEGGSGVPLNRKKYEESAAYWDQRAAVLTGNKPSGE